MNRHDKLTNSQALDLIGNVDTGDTLTMQRGYLGPENNPSYSWIDYRCNGKLFMYETWEGFFRPSLVAS